MKIIFKYDLKMEWENYIRIRASINHPEKPVSKFEIMATEVGVDVSDKKQVLDYYKKRTDNYNIDIEKVIKDFQIKWDKIADEVESRNIKLFNTRLDLGNITAYLTIRDRCAYNIQLKYFFVCMCTDHSDRTSMHEFQHFYTHMLIYPKLENAGLNNQEQNDFKEALTFLLNIEFKDLMGDAVDEGYTKQIKIRSKFEQLWQKHPSIEFLTQYYINHLKDFT